MSEEMTKLGVECQGNHAQLKEDMEKRAATMPEGNVAATECKHCGKMIEGKKKESK